jgi:hypothetical protein
MRHPKTGQRLKADLDSLLLDHDYLRHGILEAYRRAQRWFALAEESRRAFDASDSIWRQWQTLLSPWQQIGLLFQRFRGQFRYEKYRRYAALSLLRFIPHLVILFAVGFGWRGCT